MVKILLPTTADFNLPEREPWVWVGKRYAALTSWYTPAPVHGRQLLCDHHAVTKLAGWGATWREVQPGPGFPAFQIQAPGRKTSGDPGTQPLSDV